MKFSASFPVVLVLATALSVTQQLSAQSLQSPARLSQTGTGEGGNAESTAPKISSNGTYLVFTSFANNLVTGDTNTSPDVFLRNLSTGALTRLSVGPLGVQADDASQQAAISATAPNGFFAVAFRSEATNLALFPSVFPDTNNLSDIYFSLPTQGVTERISVAPGPEQADGSSLEPSVAIIPEPNRVVVAFTSNATNLVSGVADSNGEPDIYLATLTAPADFSSFSYTTDLTTVRVSRAAASHEQPNGESGKPALSSDGRYVVYESVATNLVSGVTPTEKQIYLFDSQTGTTTLISRSASGAPGDRDSFSPSINYRGSFITYMTTATNILADGITTPPNALQVIRYEVQTGTSLRVNVTAEGVAGNGSVSGTPTTFMNPSGRFITFADTADNLVANDNGTPDVFLKDMTTGVLLRASTSTTGGAGDATSEVPALAGNLYNSDSSSLSFASSASNLTSQDSEGRKHVYVSGVATTRTPLAKKTQIEVPPDTSSVRKSITVRMQAFAGVNLAAAVPRSAAAPLIAAARPRARRPKPVIQYVAQVAREQPSGKLRVVQKAVSKKNSFTFKRLPAGVYVVSYRTEIRRGSKRVSTTNQSPPQRVRIS